ILWPTGGAPLVGGPAGQQWLTCCVAGFDNNSFDFARAAAAEGRGTVVFGRGEAGDALLEGGKLDHHEAVELGRPFHDLAAAAARKHFAAELGDDTRHEVGVFLVLGRIVDLGSRNPVGRHDVLLRIWLVLARATKRTALRKWSMLRK